MSLAAKAVESGKVSNLWAAEYLLSTVKGSMVAIVQEHPLDRVDTIRRLASEGSLYCRFVVGSGSEHDIATLLTCLAPRQMTADEAETLFADDDDDDEAAGASL